MPLRRKKGDPYATTAGQPLSADYNPMALLDKTPAWPSNFGGVKIAKGPAPSGCAPFEIIVARGTSEPGPFGAIAGDPVVARAKVDIGEDKVRGYAVQYDATITSFLDGVGSADISGRVKKKAVECPNMKFAVIGYSQGGMIAASGLGGIPKNLADKVIAVVFYAPFGGATPPAEYKGKYLQHCASGDPVCLNGADTSKHTSYNSKGTKWHEATRKFLKAAFDGQPLQANPGSSWTAPWLKAL